jgi:hypothetical protein
MRGIEPLTFLCQALTLTPQNRIKKKSSEKVFPHIPSIQPFPTLLTQISFVGASMLTSSNSTKVGSLNPNGNNGGNNNNNSVRPATPSTSAASSLSSRSSIGGGQSGSDDQSLLLIDGGHYNDDNDNDGLIIDE